MVLLQLSEKNINCLFLCPIFTQIVCDLAVTLQQKRNTTMKIRIETPADYRAVEELTREAFWDVYRPGT